MAIFSDIHGVCPYIETYTAECFSTFLWVPLALFPFFLFSFFLFFFSSEAVFYFFHLHNHHAPLSILRTLRSARIEAYSLPPLSSCFLTRITMNDHEFSEFGSAPFGAEILQIYSNPTNKSNRRHINTNPTPPCGHPSPSNGRGVPGGHKPQW